MRKSKCASATRASSFFEEDHLLPISKDGCGVFGILRKNSAPKIPASKAILGIASASYRGSNLGAGYASFSTGLKTRKFRVKAFVLDAEAAARVENGLLEIGEVQKTTLAKPRNGSSRMAIWEGNVLPRGKDPYTSLELAVDRINLSLARNKDEEIRGRVFSHGKYLNVYKEVGYPLDVARRFDLEAKEELADAWIAHTRQPTNSPGELPIWSHPFASSECAVVHNGDISSFGANAELLTSWGLQSHVGTDSEVAARLLDHLLRVEKLSIGDAAKVMTSPYERNSVGDEKTRRLLSKYGGARLDGPFAIVAGYSDGKDTYLIALIDRSKFRPLLLGEDSDNFYVASEESQIRNLSPHATIWTPDPGSFFVASFKQGLIESGRLRKRPHVDYENSDDPGLDIAGKSSSEINSMISNSFLSGASEISLKNARGERFIGIGLSIPRSRDFTVKIQGLPGNCLANLNDGATFIVYGNAADDVSDTMHSGRVIIHGSARDVLGQALQGGEIFVRGSVGNRAAIQMREYQKESRPYVLVGESADDYLGEYMAGGVACILNLSGAKDPIGNYTGTGMVGGAIYVRGRASETRLGLLPSRIDVMNYLEVLKLEGAISQELFQRISEMEYPLESSLRELLPGKIFDRVRSIFFQSKYTKPLVIERRTLSSEDGELQLRIKDFFREFALPESLLDEVLLSEFTIIRAGEEVERRRAFPPQEVPIEE